MAIGKNSDKIVAIVSKEVKAKLTEIADKNRRSVSEYVAILIEKDIEAQMTSP